MRPKTMSVRVVFHNAAPQPGSPSHTVPPPHTCCLGNPVPASRGWLLLPGCKTPASRANHWPFQARPRRNTDSKQRKRATAFTARSLKRAGGGVLSDKWLPPESVASDGDHRSLSEKASFFGDPVYPPLSATVHIRPEIRSIP
jgi:hypothetical protein